ncbi:MAG: AfsR/SARP family transcriptional regulator [Acidimicrobiales bacterium]
MRKNRNVRVVARLCFVLGVVVLIVDFALLVFTPVPGHVAGAGGVTTSTVSAYEDLGAGQQADAPGAAFSSWKSSDTRLNGSDFSLQVEGYGTATSISTNFGEEVADPGYTLAVVEYALTFFGDTGPQVLVTAGKDAVSLGNPALLGQWTTAVAVPIGSHPVLSASFDGLSQSFSFATGLNTGTVVPILYRNSDGGPAISTSVRRSVTLAVTGAGDKRVATDTLTIDSAKLTWFSPSNPLEHPSSSDEAYLVVKGTEGSAVTWYSALSPDRLKLLLPGGKVVDCEPDSDYAKGFAVDQLGGGYYFEVPDTFTTGTLEVTPGSGQGNLLGPNTAAGTGTDTVVGTASFPISFPPAPKAPPTVAAKPASNSRHPVAPKTKKAAPARHSPLPAVDVELLVGAGAAVFLVLLLPFIGIRRRSRLLAVDQAGRVLPVRPALPAVPKAEGATSSEVSREPVEDRPALVTASQADVPASRQATLQEAPPERQAETAEPQSEEICVHLLGPLEFSGLARKPRRPAVLAILCYLACHPGRRCSNEEIRDALWQPADDFAPAEATEGSFRSYISILRKAVGETRLPRSDNGYKIGPGVTTDWERFKSLCSLARESPPPEALGLYEQALSLVRGAPFENASKRYEWALLDGTVSKITIEVERATHELAQLRIELCDGSERSAP